MHRNLKRLHNAGLHIDWRTIHVAWRGDVWTHRAIGFGLSDKAVRDYALETLERYIGTDWEYSVFLVADADLTDHLGFARRLADLAERSGVDEQTAMRKWRYASLKPQIDAVRIPDGEDELVLLDVAEELYDISREWRGIVSLHSVPEVDFDWHRSEIESGLRLLRDWLEREGDELRRIEAASRDATP